MASGLFPNPFTNRTHVSTNPAIAAVYKSIGGSKDWRSRYAAVTRSSRPVDYEDMQQWYDNCRPIEQSILREAESAEQEILALRKAAEDDATQLAKLDEEIEASKNTSIVLELDNQGHAEKIGEEFEHMLETLIKSCGKEFIKGVVHRKTGPIGYSKDIPLDVILAFKKYIPEATDVCSWEVKEVCAFIEDIGAAMKELRRKSPPPEELQRLTLAPEHLERLVLKISESHAAVSVMQSPTKSRTTQAPRSHFLHQSDSELEDVELEEVTMVPESDKIELELLLEEARTETTEARKEVAKLQSMICKNFTFGIQSSYPEAVKLASAVFHIPLDEGEAIPYTHSREALVFADSYDVGKKPQTMDILLYLQVMYDDIIGTSENPRQLETSQIQSEVHLPWLGTMIRHITINGKDDEIGMLFRLIQSMIDLYHPRALGRSCLFIIVANITQRTDDPLDGMWISLYQQILVNEFGYPYLDWDLLSRVCFCWFMATGPESSLEALGLDESELRAIEETIHSLKTQMPRDFVGLLSHSAIKTMIAIENNGAEVILLKNKNSDRMVILRTGIGNSTVIGCEYIFCKSGGRSSTPRMDSI